ncbi:RNA-binding protein Musashi Rbp6 like [Heracleum sosnowskyi]|uniref:RNA-binding protein Musashi Rbp6 like n=1 Tax=Heracleum sosnowskyi TaxID=360622 RepID=A0AAD8HK50_9APIA|nr:RNA-binding protein Musashi Rbp6 like [Heracleum sosnowskyi]
MQAISEFYHTEQYKINKLGFSIIVMEGFPPLPGSQPQIEVHISLEEFRLFHSIDRRLYSILVADLLRDPVEAMQIMALWLWLERVGFFNIVKRILEWPVMLINDLAEEANICLAFIDNPLSLLLTSEASEIPLSQSVIQKNFSLQYLQNNLTLAKHGVEKVRNTVCMRAFNDLMEQAILRNEAQRIVESQQLLVQQTMLSNSLGNNVVPADERTMFVTFSKGYPVTECEVREFFVKIFGECIESFYMQEVRDTEDQALFARIVFFRPDIIHMILNGVHKAKFTINGKHVWMRKFVPKKTRSVTGQSSHRNHNNGVA